MKPIRLRSTGLVLTFLTVWGMCLAQASEKASLHDFRNETTTIAGAAGSLHMSARIYSKQQLNTWLSLIKRQRCLGFNMAEIQRTQIVVGTDDLRDVNALQSRVLRLGIPADAFKVVRVVISVPEGNPPGPPDSLSRAVPCK